MKREFKAGDKIEIIKEGTGDCQSADLGEIKKIKHIESGGRLIFKDDTFARPHRCKLIKPKEKQSDKIRRIVRDEMDIQNKKLERRDRTLTIAESFIGAVEKINTRLTDNNPEPQQQKSGWYKKSTSNNWLMYHDFENGLYYGFDELNGEWYEYKVKRKNFTIGRYATKATNEEVIDRLVDYIKNNLHNK